MAQNDSGEQRVRRARRGLAVFFAALVPLSALFEGLKLLNVRFVRPELVILLLMWSPAAASLIARLAMREGFKDISFRLGGRRGWRAVALAAAYPLAVGVLAYGAAWRLGLADFAPPDKDMVLTIPLWIFPLTGSARVRVAKLLVTHLTVGSLIEGVWVTGEELGWRGYLAPRLLDARVPLALPLSGLVWAVWHWPLIFVYSEPGQRVASALLFAAVFVPMGSAMARQRLETGSLWPAIVLHTVWNEVIGLVFGPCTPNEALWLGESGVLVAIVSFAVLTPLIRGRWLARRTPSADPYAELTMFRRVAERPTPEGAILAARP
jgi:membrane protease YdiL (CAAX protease family)